MNEPASQPSAEAMKCAQEIGLLIEDFMSTDEQIAGIIDEHIDPLRERIIYLEMELAKTKDMHSLANRNTQAAFDALNAAKEAIERYSEYRNERTGMYCVTCGSGFQYSHSPDCKRRVALAKIKAVIG
jgi:hypothetical protein